MSIKPFIISSQTTEEDLKAAMEDFKDDLGAGKSVAFVVKKELFPMMEKRSIKIITLCCVKQLYNTL